ALLLSAEMSRLSALAATAERQLQPPPDPEQGLRLQEVQANRIEAPFKLDVFSDPKLQLSVYGLEVGGILSSAYKAIAMRNASRVVVTGDANTAFAAMLPPNGQDGIWAQVNKDPNQPLSERAVLSELACAIAQRYVSQTTPKVQALEVASFRALLDILSGV